jgi:hypothetical protein
LLRRRDSQSAVAAVALFAAMAEQSAPSAAQPTRLSIASSGDGRRHASILSNRSCLAPGTSIAGVTTVAKDTSIAAAATPATFSARRDRRQHGPIQGARGRVATLSALSAVAAGSGEAHVRAPSSENVAACFATRGYGGYGEAA